MTEDSTSRYVRDRRNWPAWWTLIYYLRESPLGFPLWKRGLGGFAGRRHRREDHVDDSIQLLQDFPEGPRLPPGQPILIASSMSMTGMSSLIG